MNKSVSFHPVLVKQDRRQKTILKGAFLHGFGHDFVARFRSHVCPKLPLKEQKRAERLMACEGVLWCQAQDPEALKAEVERYLKAWLALLQDNQLPLPYVYPAFRYAPAAQDALTVLSEKRPGTWCLGEAEKIVLLAPSPPKSRFEKALRYGLFALSMVVLVGGLVWITSWASPLLVAFAATAALAATIDNWFRSKGQATRLSDWWQRRQAGYQPWAGLWGASWEGLLGLGLLGCVYLGVFGSGVHKALNVFSRVGSGILAGIYVGASVITQLFRLHHKITKHADGLGLVGYAPHAVDPTHWFASYQAHEQAMTLKQMPDHQDQCAQRLQEVGWERFSCAEQEPKNEPRRVRRHSFSL